MTRDVRPVSQNMILIIFEIRTTLAELIFFFLIFLSVFGGSRMKSPTSSTIVFLTGCNTTSNRVKFILTAVIRHAGHAARDIRQDPYWLLNKTVRKPADQYSRHK